jgi:hypothetical protein
MKCSIHHSYLKFYYSFMLFCLIQFVPYSQHVILIILVQGVECCVWAGSVYSSLPGRLALPGAGCCRFSSFVSGFLLSSSICSVLICSSLGGWCLCGVVCFVAWFCFCCLVCLGDRGDMGNSLRIFSTRRHQVFPLHVPSLVWASPNLVFVDQNLLHFIYKKED